MRLDWPADIVQHLSEEARGKGLSLDTYLLQSILQRNGHNGDSEMDDRRRRREVAAARIRELREGITLGPGVYGSRPHRGGPALLTARLTTDKLRYRRVVLS